MVQKLLPQKYSLRAFVSKCESLFVRLFEFSRQQETLSGVLCRVHARETFGSRLARLKRTFLPRLIVKKFSRHKTHYKYKSSIHDFCTFCCRHAKSLSCRMIEIFILFKSALRQLDLPNLSKNRPFRNFQPISPLHVLQQPYASLYFLYSNVFLCFSFRTL